LSNPAEERPDRWFRFTNRVNTILWEAPLPRRLKVLLSQLAFHSPPMPQGRVIETLAALEGAGVRTAIMGGWGVDALAGREQRPHHDLDLLTDSTQFEAALEVLERLGYERWNRSSDPDPLGNIDLLATETMRDPALRVVDLHSTRLDAAGLGLATGRIGECEVVCISPQQQLDSQTGKAWTWGRLQRRRAMYATMTALMSGTGGAELLSNASSVDSTEPKPGLARSADDGEGRDGM
jgi:lincosamide nucleotidyltransferase A/C/D/E